MNQHVHSLSFFCIYWNKMADKNEGSMLDDIETVGIADYVEHHAIFVCLTIQMKNNKMKLTR